MVLARHVVFLAGTHGRISGMRGVWVWDGISHEGFGLTMMRFWAAFDAMSAADIAVELG